MYFPLSSPIKLSLSEEDSEVEQWGMDPFKAVALSF